VFVPLEHLLFGVLAVASAPSVEPELQKAVVQIGGRCSGTLVAGDGVLTSAHCLTAPVGEIFVGGVAFPVQRCYRDAAYRPGLPAHDLGYCRLARVSPGAIPIDDGPPPAVGAPVRLAGYGSSNPLARDCPALRTIVASVVGVRPGRMEVGSATATACRGDSGGPMLVDRGGAPCASRGSSRAPRGPSAQARPRSCR